MSKRRGANTRSTIDPAVLKRLNEGSLESATLAEALAVDFGVLIDQVAPGLSPQQKQPLLDAHARGITRRMDLAARILSTTLAKSAATKLKRHPSDTVRGWSAFMIGRDTKLSLERKLTLIRPLADDSHFGVREWAWLALRNTLVAELDLSIRLLTPWLDARSENLRRFAIEATRPRGVWAKHIPELKRSPERGRILLDKVMQDPSRYVQNSCANWLNDAAKSQAEWVTGFCVEWQSRSSSPATAYIVKRALRNIA